MDDLFLITTRLIGQNTIYRPSLEKALWCCFFPNHSPKNKLRQSLDSGRRGIRHVTDNFAPNAAHLLILLITAKIMSADVPLVFTRIKIIPHHKSFLLFPHFKYNPIRYLPVNTTAFICMRVNCCSGRVRSVVNG